MNAADVASLIDEATRTIEDWPSPGVTFRDITPLLGDPSAFASVIDALAARVTEAGPVPGAVVGVEARGFIVGAPLALRLGVGFVPVRKKGKLPARTHEVTYDLEYATATLEIHTDALAPGTTAVIVDDVLATGGTMSATCDLVRRCGADPVAVAVLMELSDLGGRGVLDVPCLALRTYGETRPI
ncbi:MAG: adenine phosphoribosyltransferase [Aeromicrobium sp.]